MCGMERENNIGTFGMEAQGNNKEGRHHLLLLLLLLFVFQRRDANNEL